MGCGASKETNTIVEESPNCDKLIPNNPNISIELQENIDNHDLIEQKLDGDCIELCDLYNLTHNIESNEQNLAEVETIGVYSSSDTSTESKSIDDTSVKENIIISIDEFGKIDEHFIDPCLKLNENYENFQNDHYEQQQQQQQLGLELGQQQQQQQTHHSHQQIDSNLICHNFTNFNTIEHNIQGDGLDLLNLNTIDLKMKLNMENMIESNELYELDSNSIHCPNKQCIEINHNNYDDDEEEEEKKKEDQMNLINSDQININQATIDENLNNNNNNNQQYMEEMIGQNSIVNEINSIVNNTIQSDQTLLTTTATVESMNHSQNNLNLLNDNNNIIYTHDNRRRNVNTNHLVHNVQLHNSSPRGDGN